MLKQLNVYQFYLGIDIKFDFDIYRIKLVITLYLVLFYHS